MNNSDKPEQHSAAIPALQLSRIGKTFGKTAALQDISLDVQTGEIICLVGHSGCGKTTLLRIISGVDSPDQGTVHIAGQPMADLTHFIEPERRSVGVVFQDYALFPHLTVQQNVMFGLRNTPKKSAQLRAATLIELVGLSHMAGRYPHMLSGGEQQRVALARALAPAPDILLMDEPFSNLDRGLREKVRRETIALLRELKTTVIIVTHDGEEALSAGDRIVLMKSGRIIQSGNAHTLYDQPNGRYAADFFCNFNVIDGMLASGRVETPLGTFTAPDSSLKDGAVAVYLRPQDIHPVPDGPLSEDMMTGLIESRIFLGEVEELMVRVEGVPVALRLRTPQRLPENLKNIRLRIDCTKAFLFAP